YSGYSPARLRELLSARNRNTEEIKQFLVHYLTLHIVLSKQTGVTQILEALHFPVAIGQLTEFGNLPVSFISAEVSTFRPPDAVIIESTEIAGMDAFEEVVNLDDIAALRDPLKERLMEAVRSHGENLLSQ